MKKEMNKKGQDLSIGTLILIVLGVVVLVLLILGFSMGWDNLWKKINIFGGTSSQGDIVTACRLASTSQDTYTLCSKSWEIKNAAGDKETYSCIRAKTEGLLDFDLNCQAKTCESYGTGEFKNECDSAKEWQVPANFVTAPNAPTTATSCCVLK